MGIRRLHSWVAVIGVAAASGVGWWLMQKADKARPAEPGAAATASAGGASRAGTAAPVGGGPAAVEVAPAEAMRIEDDAQAVGSLRAAQTVMVRPEVSGRIVKIGFSDGARVKRGQLLAQLDDQLQVAQLRQAEAQAHIARTNLVRSRELQAQNFVSQSAVDQNAAALDVAEAQVALARAQLSRLAIRAPFDGVAGIKGVALGDYVKDGADIVSLEDRSRMWVDFRLPERYAGRTRAGQSVQVSLDAVPGRSYAGMVEALDALVDSNGRSLLVRARVDRPGPELKSGMFARARIVFAVRERAVMVPEEALVPQGGKQFLILAVPATQAEASAPSGRDNGGGPRLVSKRIEAQLGVRTVGKVEVIQGVSPGDLVVTAGHARALRGDALPLRVIDINKPQGPGVKQPGGAASAARPGAPA